MTTALLSLITGPNGILVGLGAVLLAIVGAFMKGRLSGAAKERQKRTEDRLKARTIADDIDDAVAGRAPATNREELKKWSGH